MLKKSRILTLLTILCLSTTLYAQKVDCQEVPKFEPKIGSVITYGTNVPGNLKYMSPGSRYDFSTGYSQSTLYTNYALYGSTMYTMVAKTVSPLHSTKLIIWANHNGKRVKLDEADISSGYYDTTLSFYALSKDDYVYVEFVGPCSIIGYIYAQQ